MAVDLTQLTQTEQAVADTLRGWGAELDNEQKFWWADWTSMIRDTITAMRTGDPVMYEDATERTPLLLSAAQRGAGPTRRE